MSNKPTGGPAFPVPNLQDDPSFNGMTLRDYFATHASEEDIAVQFEIIRIQHMKNGVLPDGYQAKARYMHADDMLKAREQK